VRRTPRQRLALHWKILIGLLLGVVVGIAINLFWDAGTWLALGVDNPPAYLKGAAGSGAVVPVLPEGVASVQDLDPDDESLRGLRPYQLNAEQIARFGLQTQAANTSPSLWAGSARLLGGLVGFVGDLFIRGLRFIAVPLVLFSLIVGASSLNDLRKLSRIGGKTIVLYLCTTALAITIGLLLANAVKPGSFVGEQTRDRLAMQGRSVADEKIGTAEQTAEGLSVWGQLLEMVPKNPFASLAQTRMLQIVVTALVIGIGLTLVPREKAAPVIAVCDGMTEVVIKLVNVGMLAAPYAVFALIVKVTAVMGLDVLRALVVYSVVVIVGLAVMMLGVYPLILRLGTRVGYRRFFRGIAPAQLLAFSSSSSAATLPVTMECCEERIGVSEEVSSFVLPLGATVNMDGTALYQGVAALFIAQLFSIPLGFVDQLTIIITATLASIGTAAVPSAGLIMLVIVLQQLRFPQEVMASGIAILFAVDRLLDMCRTACNITGDSMVATFVAATEGDLLSEDEVRRRFEDKRASGLDEHPHEGTAHEYGVPLGGPGRPVEPSDPSGGQSP